MRLQDMMESSPVSLARLRSPWRSPAFWGSAFLALVPLVVLVCMVHTYRITVPYRDHWFVLGRLHPWYEGTFGFRHLWEQEAEHRHPFPYLVMLGLGVASRWNINWELATSILLACSLFVSLAVGCARVLHSPQHPLSRWCLLPFLSLVVFSLTQFENWLWGWHLIVFMNVSSAVAGMSVLAASPRRPWQFALGLFLGVVASYSFANGFTYWVAAGVILWLTTTGRSGRIQRTLWILTALVTVAVFAYGYKLPRWSAPGYVVFSIPARFVRFTLTYLGAPVLPGRVGAACAAGGVGLAILLWTSWRLLRRWSVEPARLAFLWAIALYATGSAVLVSAGRANFAVAISPRYITTSSLFWVANASLLWLLMRHEAADGHLRRAACGVVLVAMVGLFATGSFRARRDFVWYHNRLAPAQAELLRMRDENLLKRLYPNVKELREMVDLLKKHRLTIFRDLPEPKSR